MTTWDTWRVSPPDYRMWAEFVGPARSLVPIKAMTDSFLTLLSILPVTERFEGFKRIQYEAWYIQHIIEHSPSLIPSNCGLLREVTTSVWLFFSPQWWELNMCDVRSAGLLMVKRPPLWSPVTIECCNLLHMKAVISWMMLCCWLQEAMQENSHCNVPFL